MLVAWKTATNEYRVEMKINGLNVNMYVYL